MGQGDLELVEVLFHPQQDGEGGEGSVERQDIHEGEVDRIFLVIG